MTDVQVFLALFLASGTSYATSSSQNSGDSQVHWGPCDPTVANDTSLSCGFLDVPLDYQNPKIGTARLALIKANATGERRGTVQFNPGGPGGSGLESVVENKDLLLAFTGGVYDVVSWDPRGVGLTTPSETYCFESLDEYNAFFKGTIELTGIEETGNFTDPADVAALMSQASLMQDKYEEVGQKCLRSPNGKFLKYMGTAAAVRDMVSIADVLDGPQAPVNYLGTSYGTLIGAWFVNMFPERVGRVILDGVLDPVRFATQEYATHWPNQLVSDDTIYKAFITGCALAGPAGCAAASEGDGPLDIDVKFQALLKAAHDATRLNSSVPLTSGQIRSNLFNEMYFPADWTNLVNEVYPQVVEIVRGESGQNASVSRTKRASSLVSRDLLRKRQANETKSYTSQAVFCGDSIDLNPKINMTDVFSSIIDGTRSISHLFGSVWPTSPYQCSFWPVRSVERYSGPFNKKLANKILIASSTYDPVTPLVSAQLLAGLLGDSAALVRVNGFGHTTVGAPSSCMTAIAAAYMINGTVPMNNTVCEVDSDFELFPGVNTADILANMPDTDV